MIKQFFYKVKVKLLPNIKYTNPEIYDEQFYITNVFMDFNNDRSMLTLRNIKNWNIIDYGNDYVKEMEVQHNEIEIIDIEKNAVIRPIVFLNDKKVKGYEYDLLFAVREQSVNFFFIHIKHNNTINSVMIEEISQFKFIVEKESVILKSDNLVIKQDNECGDN